MTNPIETKQQYEGAILQQPVKNAEDLAVIKFQQQENKSKIEKIDLLEQKIDKIYSILNNLKWLLVTIGVGVLINIISPPIVSFFN